jgi:hypothetical protein
MNERLLPEPEPLGAETSYTSGGMQTVAALPPPINFRDLESMLAARYEERARMQSEEISAARQAPEPPPRAFAAAGASRYRPRPYPSPGAHGPSAAAQALQERLKPYFMSQISSGPGILGGYVETDKPGLNTVAGGYRMY